jgi:hypothetical protein
MSHHALASDIPYEPHEKRPLLLRCLTGDNLQINGQLSSNGSMYSLTGFSGNDDVLCDSQTDSLVSKLHLRRAGTIKAFPSPSGTSDSLWSPKRYGDKAAGAWAQPFAYTDNRVKECAHRHIIEWDEFCGLWYTEWVIGPPYNLPLGSRTTREISTPVFDSFGTHWPPASCLPACLFLPGYSPSCLHRDII